MEIILELMIFLAGLCAGSFVNMLVYRTAKHYGLPNNEDAEENDEIKVPFLEQIKNYFCDIWLDMISIFGSEKRSYCDGCGRQLKWYENIPVMSWVIQRGRTKCCQCPLPYSYPLVEIGTGLLFVIMTNNQIPITKQLINFQLLNAQNLIILIISLIIVTMLVFEAVFDLKYMILPDFGLFIMEICTVGLIVLGQIGFNFQQNIVSALGAFGFLLILHIVTKGKGMGMGDVKYAVLMGLLLGYPKIIVGMYIAFIVGAIVGVILMILKKATRKSMVPFGPFLILGTVVTWWWGETILKFVINKF